MAVTNFFLLLLNALSDDLFEMEIFNHAHLNAPIGFFWRLDTRGCFLTCEFD